MCSDFIILYIDKKNLNNNIYSKEVVDEMIDECKNKTIYGKIGMCDSPNIDLSEVSHVVTNLRIEKDMVIGTVSIIENKNGNGLKKMLKNQSVVFRTQGEANITGSGEIDSFKLLSINVIDKKEDAFGEKK